MNEEKFLLFNIISNMTEILYDLYIDLWIILPILHISSLFNLKLIIEILAYNHFSFMII
jgi:hypothetical protein